MLNPGYYRAVPAAAALGVTGTGKEQIAVTFRLLEPADERITWYGFFTEKTLDRTLESLRHCGWTGSDLSVFAEGEPLPEGMDREVEIVVEHSEYQGKVSAKVAWVNSGAGMSMRNGLKRDEALSFAERMKKQIEALDKVSGRAPAKPAPKAKSDADVPF